MFGLLQHSYLLLVFICFAVTTWFTLFSTWSQFPFLVVLSHTDFSKLDIWAPNLWRIEFYWYFHFFSFTVSLFLLWVYNTGFSPGVFSVCIRRKKLFHLNVPRRDDSFNIHLIERLKTLLVILFNYLISRIDSRFDWWTLSYNAVTWYKPYIWHQYSNVIKILIEMLWLIYVKANKCHGILKKVQLGEFSIWIVSAIQSVEKSQRVLVIFIGKFGTFWNKRTESKM